MTAIAAASPTSTVTPIVWQQDHVVLLDQTKLPNQTTTVAIRDYEAMAQAIETMIVRGAPAIGVSAAYGMYLGATAIAADNRADFLAQLHPIAERLRATRPTAVNLFWAIAQMLKTAEQAPGDVTAIQSALLEAAHRILADDIRTCQQIGDFGLAALPQAPEKLRILTHCNAGAIATAGYGTALGVVRSAWTAGRLERVYADETRPRLQGAKLTAWECVQEGIPVTVITDNMAAHCMQRGLIDAVVVGADRIAANGDTANKIGTYSVALAAKAHNLPFFVAAPLSTIDFSIQTGAEIPIEERDPAEIYAVGNAQLTPMGAEFYNPAFDVTPAPLIAAIVTEFGAIAPAELTAKLQHRA